MQPGTESSNSGFHCSPETRIKPYTQQRAHGSCSHPHTYKSTFQQRHFPLVNLSTGRLSKCIILITQIRGGVGGPDCREDLSTEQCDQIMSASGRHLGRGPKCGSEGHSVHNWGSDLIFWIKASLHNTSVPVMESAGQLLTLTQSLNSLVKSNGSYCRSVVKGGILVGTSNSFLDNNNFLYFQPQDCL